MRRHGAGRSNGSEEYMWHVYIIKSFNKNWYYVGSTNRLEKRIAEHNAKKVISTKYHAPLKLVFKKEF
jgi:predicted GIY-YIG superfamily endonuclease